MSRIADFYRNPDKDFSKFFDSKVETEEIANIRKEINSMQLKINHKMDDLQNLYGTMYGDDFVPNNTKIYVRYSGRTNDATFSLDTLKEAEPEQGSNVIGLDGKEGVFSYLIGYSYKYGSAIIRNSEYKVSAKCDSIKITPRYEYIVPMLEDKNAQKYDYRKQESNEYDNDRGPINDAMRKISAKEFLNEMYEIDRDFNFDLDTFRRAAYDNKSFEIIVKTCPLEIINMAFKKKVSSPLPMHAVMDVDKAVYEEACAFAENENGFLTFFFSALDEYKKVDDIAKNKVNFNKTDKQYYDFAVKAWNLKKDMDFYGICNVSNYLSWVTNLYLGNAYYYRSRSFSKYYPFGKLMTYIANESINQGYQRLDNFVNELKDYLEMTERSGGVPTLYSSYLKLTHDIASRNLKIIVTEEQEEAFKNKYENIKNYNIGDYVFMSPSCTNDVKAEGNKLNHCVASYINRVIKGECLIMFMRLAKNMNESLVTLEIEGGRVAQARGMSNRNVTPEEREALVKYCQKVGLEIDE